MAMGVIQQHIRRLKLLRVQTAFAMDRIAGILILSRGITILVAEDNLHLIFLPVSIVIELIPVTPLDVHHQIVLAVLHAMLMVEATWTVPVLEPIGFQELMICERLQ
jgi:hypothetical protein